MNRILFFRKPYALLSAGLFLGFWFGSFPAAHAQADLKELRGIILHYPELMAIEDVNVINFSRGLGTTSNYLGRFVIPYEPGDTLILSSVGYRKEWFALTPIVLEQGPDLRFFLVPDTVHIAEVQIISRNYEQFKRQILAMTEIMDTMAISFPGIPRRVVGPPAEPSIMSPISLLYSVFGKKARDQRKLERYRRVYQEKYSR